MTDAVEVAIEGALLDRATDFAASQSITIALPNVQFVKPAPSRTAKYLRASFLPASTQTLGVTFTAFNKYYGLFQVDVFYGIGGASLPASRVAAAIIAYFKRGTSMARDGFTVKVTMAPMTGPLIVDGSWAMIPVRIPYVCFATNPA